MLSIIKKIAGLYIPSCLEKLAAGSVLQGLLYAKERSDIKDYTAKHKKLRELMEKHPDDWVVDSILGSVAGVTHVPSAFRLHAPLRILPDKLRYSNVQPPTAA